MKLGAIWGTVNMANYTCNQEALTIEVIIYINVFIIFHMNYVRYRAYLYTFVFCRMWNKYPHTKFSFRSFAFTTFKVDANLFPTSYLTMKIL